MRRVLKTKTKSAIIRQWDVGWRLETCLATIVDDRITWCVLIKYAVEITTRTHTHVYLQRFGKKLSISITY